MATRHHEPSLISPCGKQRYKVTTRGTGGFSTKADDNVKPTKQPDGDLTTASDDEMTKNKLTTTASYLTTTIGESVANNLLNC